MKIFREKKLGSDSHVFISYSSKDSKVARQIYRELEDLGLNPWLSEIDTAPGANYAQVIPQVIEDSLAVVVLVTKDSVKSEQVLRELNLSVGKKHLIPVNMSGRPDILKSEHAWEYYLGIVQMFEHEDNKSTAEKILENIEYTTGKKFRVDLDTPALDVSEQVMVESEALAPEVLSELPGSASDRNEAEVNVDLEPQQNTSSVIRAFTTDKKKIAIVISSLVTTLILGLVISFNNGPFVEEVPVYKSLKLDGIWADRNYLETGRGSFFMIENRDSGVSGEFYGSFTSKGKKNNEIKRAFISITVQKNGQFEGVLDDGSRLNGLVALESAENDGRAAISFEGCTQKLDWVKSDDLCEFIQVGK